MDAHEIGRSPDVEGVAPDHHRRKAREHRAVGAPVLPDIGDHLAHRRGGRGGPGLFEAARRLAHGQQDEERHEQAGEAHDEERDLPGLDLPDHRQHRRGGGGPLDHDAPHQHGEAAAEGDAAVVDAHREAQLLGREIVGDDRVGRRRERRLPHPHSHTCGEQTPEAVGETAGHRRQAPERDAQGDEVAAAARVDPSPERQAQQGVERREGEADQEAYLRLGQAEVGADRVDHQAQEHAVDEREHVGQHQHADHIEAIRLAWGPGRIVGFGLRRRLSGQGLFAHRELPPPLI